MKNVFSSHFKKNHQMCFLRFSIEKTFFVGRDLSLFFWQKFLNFCCRDSSSLIFLVEVSLQKVLGRDFSSIFVGRCFSSGIFR